MTAEIHPQITNDPFTEFEQWYKAAVDAKTEYAEAMTLATASDDGSPSARVVLFKGIQNQGFTFYTNYESQKSIQLQENPRAALVFFWPPIYRQVRIEGRVEKMSRTDSEKYFASRPRESQLGAWASHQSHEVESFEALERKFAEYDKKFAGRSIPCPDYWGGFRLVPERFEFWWGGTRRLHYRFLFTLKDGKWNRSLLSP